MGLTLEEYLRERRAEEVLPWDHLDSGLSRAFLWQERNRAREEALTPDCRWARCLKCGVCGKEVKNLLFPAPSEDLPLPEIKASGITVWYHVGLRKEGPFRFLSQLELSKVLERALRRSGLPLAFTGGFHPHPRLSFGPALPVGVASQKEEVALALEKEIPEGEVLRRLKAVLPEELGPVEVKLVPSPEIQERVWVFEVSGPALRRLSAPDLEERLSRSLEIQKKKGKQFVRLKDWISEWHLKDGRLEVSFKPGAPQFWTLLAHFLGIPASELGRLRVKKRAL